VPARRAPKIGEHTEEVLKEVGFTANDIDSLRASHAIPPAQGKPVAAD
jgi:formyl-CoA transferase